MNLRLSPLSVRDEQRKVLPMSSLIKTADAIGAKLTAMSVEMPNFDQCVSVAVNFATEEQYAAMKVVQQAAQALTDARAALLEAQEKCEQLQAKDRTLAKAAYHKIERVFEGFGETAGAGNLPIPF